MTSAHRGILAATEELVLTSTPMIRTTSVFALTATRVKPVKRVSTIKRQLSLYLGNNAREVRGQDLLISG